MRKCRYKYHWVVTEIFCQNICYLPVVLWIRIRIHFDRLARDQDPHWEYVSGSTGAKMIHKSEENSSFEVLDVLF